MMHPPSKPDAAAAMVSLFIVLDRTSGFTCERSESGASACSLGELANPRERHADHFPNARIRAFGNMVQQLVLCLFLSISKLPDGDFVNLICLQSLFVSSFMKSNRI